MARWQPGAVGRLQEAALGLMGERGYDGTTVAAIAERAGVTERTFFRHFRDKREVLFAGSEHLRGLLVDALAAAPRDASPLVAVLTAFEAAAVFFAGRRGSSTARDALIAAHPELQERELMKMAALSEALAQALRERGVDAATAWLAAEAGVVAFKAAWSRWIGGTQGGDAADDFRALLHAASADLRALTAT